MFGDDIYTSTTNAYLTKDDFMPHVKVRDGQGQCQEVNNIKRCELKYEKRIILIKNEL